MNGYKLLLAFLGTTTFGLVQAGDCDTCQTPHRPSSACACCDDSGLLDVIDQAVGRVHSELRILSGSRGFAKNHLLADHGCDTLVGHEVIDTQDASDCPNCHSHNGVEVDGSTVIEEGVHQTTEPSSTPVKQPSRLKSVPSPGSIPDENSDPFVDEPRTSGRTIPGRTIEYQRKSPARTKYGQRYNTQAQTTSTADYWAGTEQEKASKANSVKTAAAEPSTIQDDFQNAYRRRAVDLSPTEQVANDAHEIDSQNHSILEELPAKSDNGQPLKTPLQEKTVTHSQFHNPLRP